MKDKKKTFSRRDFIKLGSGAVLALGPFGLLPSVIWVDEGLAAIRFRGLPSGGH